MSNFQELQANKLNWKLSDDERLSEKMKYLQDNVLASSHLITSSMDELNRAISAAGTTMSNAINAFNQLNYTKFMENKVEDFDEADQRREIERLEDATEKLDESSYADEQLQERDKITFALELAIAELTRKKKKNDQEDDIDPDSSVADIQQKKNKRSAFLGVAKSMKLPFVIGQPEYENHPYAGLIYSGAGQYEQMEHYNAEQQVLKEDKDNEKAQLDANAVAFNEKDMELEAGEEMKKFEEKAEMAAAVDAEEVARREAEEAAKYVNIPEPPEDELNLGALPPPDGQPSAYCPALREGKIITGRAGGPVQIPQAAGAPAQGSSANRALSIIPEVPANQIPEEIRATLEQNGMPVEQMTNETRMTLALMTQPQGEGDNGPRAGSIKQPSMADVLAKAQKMYAMSQEQQQVEVQQQVQANPLAVSQNNIAQQMQAALQQQQVQSQQQVAEDDPYSSGVLGKKLNLTRKSERNKPKEVSMWATPEPSSQAAAPVLNAGGTKPRMDLTAMMYGGSTPLFDTGALDDEEAAKPVKSGGGGMFEDESDDDGEGFLQQLKKPAAEQKSTLLAQATATGAGAPQAPQKKKPKSNNPFGSSSDEDDNDYAASKTNKAGGGYQGKPKKLATFLDNDEDDEEEKFVPKAKPQEKPAPKQKKKLLMDSDEDEEDAAPIKKKPVAAAAASTKKPAAKKNMFGGDSDEEDSDDFKIKPKPKNQPVAAAAPKKAVAQKKKLFGGDDDDDDSSDGGIKAAKPAPRSALKKAADPTANAVPEKSMIPSASTQAKQRRSTVKFMDNVDDEDSDDHKPAPAKKDPVRESVASSQRASENIRATEVPAFTPPPPTKEERVESPKEEKKLSIAELAARINVGAIGGRATAGGIAPPQIKKTTVAKSEAVGGLNADGSMNHLNFADKPVTVVPKKAAAKKNVFFSDSDEDEVDSKPVAAAKPAFQQKAPPVTVAKPESPKKPVVVAQPEPIPVQQQQPQVDESTRQYWGDGQWYADANGAYFYYDEMGQAMYYTGEDYGAEDANDGGYGQDEYAQDMFSQQATDAAQNRMSGRPSIAAKGGRPSISGRPPSMKVPASPLGGRDASPMMKSVPEVDEKDSFIAQKSNVMEQRAAAMAEAQKPKVAKAKSKYMESSDENESSDEDVSDNDVPAKKATPQKQAAAAPAQTKAQPKAAIAKPQPKKNLFGASDDDDESSEEEIDFKFKRPGAQAAKPTPAAAQVKAPVKKPAKKMWESSDEDD